MKRAVQLALTSPHYILGRFHTVRRAYSAYRSTKQWLSSDPYELRIGEFYASETDPLSVRSTGSTSSTREPAEHLRQLRSAAFSEGLHLHEDTRARLLSEAKTRPLKVGSDRQLSFEELTAPEVQHQSAAIASVLDSSKLEVVRAIAGEPTLVDVVGSYLRYRPERVSTWLFWSPRNTLSDAERAANYQTVRFHYDVHSFNFLYVNFYLVDTDERNGAHVLIEGTHRDKRARHLWGSARISDLQAQRDFGPGRIRVLSGRAGDGFFEDTACYHKALPPIERDRLMLQLRYQ